MNLSFHFMVNLIVGYVNRHQQAVIEYLTEERQILIEQLGGKPKAFNNSQRIRLAQKAKKLGRRALFGDFTYRYSGHLAQMVPQPRGRKVDL